VDDQEATPDDGFSDLAREAYAIACRGLERQESVLNGLRSRVATLLAAASIVASLLGALAIDREGLDVFAVLALVAFAVSIVSGLWVLLPRSDMIFRLDGTAVIEHFDGQPLDHVHHCMTYWIEGYIRGNAPAITKTEKALYAAAVALVLQALLWALHLSAIVDV
jgi:hypothetical protein